ncbi:MAG: response regulator [Desmonostoc vinosum HA7617-LM4]|jgi:signal transduction histidine kinase|nr:response regulator [Desmonostoc vinosum HA7617-LM4]
MKKDIDFFENTTILIVDDNPTNLKVLSNAIAHSGCEILVSIDGESAIEQAQYAQPDLILLDVMMSGIDGFQTCQKLKNNSATQDIPVIFLTALSDKFDKVQGLLIGGVDYITKPFQVEEVLARIQVQLKLRYLTKQLEAQNRHLDQRVEERTKELSQALNKLKQSQLQLIQSEKLSSLGQLVAGIAHEINNPLSFIVGNFEFINNYLSALINHLQLYHQHYPNPNIDIVENANFIELEQLIQDTPHIISSINTGLARISNISSSLRTFSRIDISNKILFDIHEGIDSTLIILSHRLKYNQQRSQIEVIKNYSNLPLVECYPEQINQVFMNLLANAIDALDENSQNLLDRKLNNNNMINTITITTGFNEDKKSVSINFKDNAMGVPLEIQEHIFEQFFTTKPRGKGTGLGLSISRQIIEEKHNGSMKCFSVLGEGTEFLVEIPVK